MGVESLKMVVVERCIALLRKHQDFRGLVFPLHSEARNQRPSPHGVSKAAVEPAQESSANFGLRSLAIFEQSHDIASIYDENFRNEKPGARFVSAADVGADLFES